MRLPARFETLFAAAALIATSGSCMTARDAQLQSDAIVEDVLGDHSGRLNDWRREIIELPTERDPAPQQAPTTVTVAPGTRMLSLRDALRTAIETNRGYRTEMESLYRTALSLFATRFQFSPQLSSTLNYVFAGADPGAESGSATFGGGVSQRFPWGGSISADANVSNAQNWNGASDPYDASVSIRLTQPLLRGAGFAVTLESLTQAERSLMYQIRDFELFRENFSIDVASRFYDLVQQKRALENQRANLDELSFAYRKAEAMFRLGDIIELDVLRARRSELTAQNDLIAGVESYRLAVDRFRIFLGLPEDVRIEVQDEAPEFVPAPFDVDSAIEVALKNRLDVLTRRERLQDVERQIKLAENGLLPDLNLNLAYTLGSQGGSNLFGEPFDQQSVSASVSYELPVIRVDERERMRNAQIALGRARRDYDEFEQTLVIEVRARFRELQRRTQSLDIQRELIADQERNVEIAKLRVEQGDFSNRDVFEATQALLEARNTLIQEQVNYELARLALIRDLGILFIDENGMWTE